MAMVAMKRLCRRLAWMLAFGLLAAVDVQAGEVLRASESSVKAAFLFKFGDYVEWPPGAFATATEPVTIGVLDTSPVADELAATAAARTIAGRPIAVRLLHPGEPLTGLDIAYFDQPSTGDLSELLAPLKGSATLVVTDSAQGLRAGGVINFVLVADKVRFDVSLPSAQARGLKVSSRLLAVARKVIGGPR
jgi:hypothetical protein